MIFSAAVLSALRWTGSASYVAKASACIPAIMHPSMAILSAGRLAVYVPTQAKQEAWPVFMALYIHPIKGCLYLRQFSFF